MENEMKAARAATIGSKVDSKSEMDRLASYITHQEELIHELQVRLRPVSHPLPQSEGPERASTDEFHLSAFIERVARNNEVLKTIHSELAI